jgi:RND family efflux transporter MFP subunit
MKPLLSVVFAATALALAFSSCARRAEEAPRRPRLVSAASVERRDFVLSTEYAARIVPSLEVNITPKVGGKVATVLVEVGMSVAEGQTLCTLDASDYQAQYRQAKAVLGSAEASLTRTSDSGREQQTVQARSAADQAQVGYDEAKSSYDRTKRLFDSGSISRQRLEEVEARYKEAAIQRDAANSALALVEDKAGSQANEIASSQVDQASAQAELAKSQLDATAIRSPIAGRVSYRNVEAGEFVGSSTLVFVIIDDRRVVAETGLSERVVGAVRKGMMMELVVPTLGEGALEGALGEGRLEGTVDSVSPSADPRSMLYTVRLVVPNPYGRLRGGMLARVRVPLETRHGALLVPERATFTENGGDYVFVVSTAPAGGGEARESLASQRLVKLGESDGSRVEAIEGLSEGELVITSGQEFLGNGDRVTVAP